jgi:hypothetical protein
MGKQLTGMGAQVPLAATVDFKGNAIIAGYFEGTADVGGKTLQSVEMADAFVAKFDSDGGERLQRELRRPRESGGARRRDGRGREHDRLWAPSARAFISAARIRASRARGMSDIYVAKLNSSGAVLWRHRFGDMNDQHVTSVVTDDLGNIFMAGRFEGTIDWGDGSPLLSSAGLTDGFLVKLNPDGAHVWSQRFGDGQAQGAESVALDKDGQVLLAGWFAAPWTSATVHDATATDGSWQNSCRRGSSCGARRSTASATRAQWPSPPIRSGASSRPDISPASPI